MLPAPKSTTGACAFSVRNNYTTDQSLELGYFGVANFFNSFFHAMGVRSALFFSFHSWMDVCILMLD